MLDIYSNCLMFFFNHYKQFHNVYTQGKMNFAHAIDQLIWRKARNIMKGNNAALYN